MMTLAIIIAAIALAVGMHFVFEWVKKLRERTRTFSEPVALPSVQTLSPQEKIVEAQPQEIQPTAEVSHNVEEPIDRDILSYLRNQQSGGIACEVAIRGAIDELGGDEEEVFKAAARAGYPALDLAMLMAKWNYGADDIDNLLSDTYDMDVPSAARMLDKVLPGDSLEARIKRLLNVFDDADDLDALIPVLSEIAGTPVMVAEALVQDTDLTTADAILKLKLTKDLPALVEVVKKVNGDLTDADEYQKLRDDGDIDFEECAKILSAVGTEPGDILAVEYEYDSFDFTDGDHRKAVFDALRPCGVSDENILAAIDSADLSDSVGTIILAAMENDVPFEKIAAFLQADWADDLSNLWEALEGAEVDPIDAIEIMHALIPPEKRRFGRLKLATAAANEVKDDPK